MKYRVEITEHKSHYIDIDADNEEEAEERAEDQFIAEHEPEGDWQTVDCTRIGSPLGMI